MNIKKFRIARGLTRKETAEVLGVKRNTVCQWENGQREPNIEKLKKLAKLFGCTVSDLIDDPAED